MKKINYILIIIGIALFAGCSTEDEGFIDDGTTDVYSGTEAGDGSTSADGNGNGNSQFEAGLMTAAEWNDLDNWGFWQSLIQDNQYYDYLNRWEMFPVQRYELILKDNDNKAVTDASVALCDQHDNFLWKTRTDNYGKAQLWGSFENTENNAACIKINYNGHDFTLTDLKAYSEGVMEYKINTSAYNSANIEIMFVVDATGSMSDELEYLKTELLDVIERVQNENSNATIRIGSVFYRDEGDDYIVRNFSLTENINEIYNAVNEQHAAGGGDYPEAVHSALEAAIVQQDWKASAVTRIAFLVLDAPPHYNSNVIEAIKNHTRLAAEKGIKFIPISASGINKETEFLLRVLSIATNGTYTFITDDSGIGNDHLEATVGQYEVEFLNDLIVRLINKYSQI